MNARRKMVDTSLRLYIDNFITTKQTENRSKATIRWYSHMLTRYLEFLGEKATV